MNILLVWVAALALLFGLAAAMEWSAIRHRVNGANGLTILVAGVLGLASMPLGFGGLWWFAGLGRAALITAAAAVIGGALWWGLVNALDRAAKKQGKT